MKIHPLNANGKYYIDQRFYLVCFEEEKQMKEAILSYPVEAIHDDGEINNQ